VRKIRAKPSDFQVKEVTISITSLLSWK